MTPRLAATPEASVDDSVLDAFAQRKHWATVWTEQIDGLLSLVQSLVTEDPHRRLVGVRVYLDRAEHMRHQLADVVRRSKADVHVLEHEHEMERARSMEAGVGQLVSRGMASEERMATYALRNRGSERRMAEIRSALSFIIDCDRHVNGVIRSIDNHRMEAITMLRSQLTVSKEEVAAFRDSS